MARTWLSIRVDLVEGMHVQELWPRPGRILLARPGMTFRMLADAINVAFARWDRSHLHAFTSRWLQSAFDEARHATVVTPGEEEREAMREAAAEAADRPDCFSPRARESFRQLAEMPPQPPPDDATPGEATAEPTELGTAPG